MSIASYIYLYRSKIVQTSTLTFVSSQRGKAILIYKAHRGTAITPTIVMVPRYKIQDFIIIELNCTHFWDH